MDWPSRPGSSGWPSASWSPYGGSVNQMLPSGMRHKVVGRVQRLAVEGIGNHRHRAVVSQRTTRQSSVELWRPWKSNELPLLLTIGLKRTRRSSQQAYCVLPTTSLNTKYHVPRSEPSRPLRPGKASCNAVDRVVADAERCER